MLGLVARMCGPRCEESSPLATPQTPRIAAAESAPRPQSPAVAKTTREPASICRFAILAQAYAPALLLISAGYDAHEHDPLAGCRVTTAGYAAMVASLRGVAEQLGIPVGLVLEGGYDLGVLTESLAASLAVLGAAEAPRGARARGAPARGPRAQRLAAHWPAFVGG